MFRKGTLTLAAAAILTTLAASTPAKAGFDLWRKEGPDPYAYQYQPRGYYPYYDSGEWRPLRDLRYRYRYNFTLPKYDPGWGSPREWHRHPYPEYRGRQWPWHW